MALDKSFYIHTSTDGELGDTSEVDIKQLVDKLKDQSKIVIHFHGGLVSKANAIASAERLKTTFMDVDAYPVFFIWESSITEVINNNLHEIKDEPLFKRLLLQLTKFTIGKLLDHEGGKDSGDLSLPKEIDVAIELNKVRDDTSEEPYDNVTALPELKELNAQEKALFEKHLEDDPSIQKYLVDIINSEADETSLSTEIVQQLHQETSRDDKGFVSSIVIIRKVTQILTRVVSRFMKGHDHGVYTTIVEELLRELYVDKIGESIWTAIKKETQDTFANSSTQKGGSLFLQLLTELILSGHQPEITLTGHSAGAVFICNFLKHFHELQLKSTVPSLRGYKFKRVIFLAPACDFNLFNNILVESPDIFEEFRMFTMTDELEAKDPIVPGLYTRSLLYFISGLLEKNPKNAQSAYDHPILGMQRYFINSNVYDTETINNVRKFILEGSKRVVWSVDNQGVGLHTSSESHGGFSEDPNTLISIQNILKEG